MPDTNIRQQTSTPPTVPTGGNFAKHDAPELDPYFKSVSLTYRVAKYITVLLLSAFLIFSFTFMRNDITLENLRYLLKFIGFTNTETSITATKINYASGDPNRLELFIGDLCTLSPQGYAIYDSRGNQIMTESLSYTSPVLKVSDRFALCYDLDGAEFTLLNTFTKLYEDTTDYPITDGAIADDGSFAIASSSREYRTAITVYNSDFKAISRIYKNDHLMGVEYTADNEKLAVMTAGADGGEFYTKLELIVPGSDSVYASCAVDGLGYALHCMDEGFAIVTDESVCFLDERLNLIKTVSHPTQLALSDASGKYLTVMYSDGVIGNSYTARVFNVDGRIVFEENFEGKLAAVDSDDSGDYIFVLTGNVLTRINLVNKKLGRMTIEPDAIDILVSDPVTVLAAYRSYALTYNLSDFEERYYDRTAESENQQ